ncbi:MAG: hypothetical protein AVDCRST_MAG89-1099, partial [uncultured Gemmatimonadetes bacterium]
VSERRVERSHRHGASKGGPAAAARRRASAAYPRALSARRAASARASPRPAPPAGHRGPSQQRDAPGAL